MKHLNEKLVEKINETVHVKSNCATVFVLCWIFIKL